MSFLFVLLMNQLGFFNVFYFFSAFYLIGICSSLFYSLLSEWIICSLGAGCESFRKMYRKLPSCSSLEATSGTTFLYNLLQFYHTTSKVEFWVFLATETLYIAPFKKLKEHNSAPSQLVRLIFLFPHSLLLVLTQEFSFGSTSSLSNFRMSCSLMASA